MKHIIDHFVQFHSSCIPVLLWSFVLEVELKVIEIIKHDGNIVKKNCLDSQDQLFFRLLQKGLCLVERKQIWVELQTFKGSGHYW